MHRLAFLRLCSVLCQQNAGIEAAYPPDYYRDDVGLLWYADVSLADGSLRQLALTPTRLR